MLRLGHHAPQYVTRSADVLKNSEACARSLPFLLNSKFSKTRSLARMIFTKCGASTVFGETSYETTRVYTRGVATVIRRKFLGVGRLSRLETAAESSPRDAVKQALLLKELNRVGEHAEVIARYESGRFAINEHCLNEYIKSLVSSNRLESSNVASAVSRLRNATNGSSASASESTNTLGGILGAEGGFKSPLPVVVHSQASRFDFVKKLGYQMISSLVFFSVFLAVFQDGSGFGKSMGGMRSDVEPHADETESFKFSDVRGCDEAKQDLVEVVEFLRSPEKFTRLGGKLPKGLLLMGPPGTGKTMLARAIAGEADVPFFYCSGSEFDEMFVGVGARRVRELFEAAKKVQPCIIFIDEIDAIGGRRNSKEGGNYSRMTLNQLLVELDGFKQNSGVIVVGATNFPQLLDEALTRPGRFDKKVHISVPDTKGRLEILEQHIKSVTLDPEVDLKVLARATSGMSGADLANMVNQAALKASMEDKDLVCVEELNFALDKIRMGAENKSRIITAENRKKTAYHEGGHALVAALNPASKPVYKATILCRGNALGMVQYLPDVDSTSVSKKEYHATLQSAMGGRAAEELMYGDDDVSSGCSSDIQSATNLAMHMVCKLGYSKKIGKVVHDIESDNLSNETRQIIDSEVKSICEEAYETALNLLRNNEDKLHLLAKALLEYETLSGEEVIKVINGEALPDRELVVPPPTGLDSGPAVALKLSMVGKNTINETPIPSLG